MLKRIFPLRLCALKDQKGVTLIEILVVVAVLGIISGAVIYNWSAFIGHQNLRKEAVSLFKELTSYKPLAIQQNNQFKVVFNTGNNSYTILRDDGTEISSKTLAQGVQFRASTVSDANPPPGTVSNPGNWTSDTLLISPDNINAFNSGRIYIERGNKEFAIQKRDSLTTLELYFWNGSQWIRM